MTKEEIEFHYLYGTIFCAAATAEASAALATILNEKDRNYQRNMAEQTAKVCTKLGEVLRREVTQGLTPMQKTIALAAVDHHKDLVYDFFLLDAKQQTRVKGLIDKMKKEAAREEVAA